VNEGEPFAAEGNSMSKGCCPFCLEPIRPRLAALRGAEQAFGPAAPGGLCGGMVYRLNCPACAVPLIAAPGRLWSQVNAAEVEWFRDNAYRIFGGHASRLVAFSSSWRTDTAIALARRMDAAQDYSAMPIFADALQDAGCDDARILDHCRLGSHVRGCWVVNLVLGQE
jgi:hypothetical protein